MGHTVALMYLFVATLVGWAGIATSQTVYFTCVDGRSKLSRDGGVTWQDIAEPLQTVRVRYLDGGSKISYDFGNTWSREHEGFDESQNTSGSCPDWESVATYELDRINRSIQLMPTITDINYFICDLLGNALSSGNLFQSAHVSLGNAGVYLIRYTAGSCTFINKLCLF